MQARCTKRKKKQVVKFPLKEVLKRKGWTQYKLAKAAGLEQSYVTTLARGRTLPGWKMVMKIATTIGADLGDFQLRPEESTATSS